MSRFVFYKCVKVLKGFGETFSKVSPKKLFFDSVKGFACAKDQRDTPDARKPYRGIDDTREQRGRSAADPSNDIELEQTNAAPVECADDTDDQRNTV